MLFDVLLLSVAVVTLYAGPMVLRRGGPQQRTYGLMLVGNLLLSLVAYFGRQSESAGPVADLLGFVAIAGAVFLVMVPPSLRRFAHWAHRNDYLRLAVALAGVREVLQPGASQEQELFRSMLDVRTGRVDDAVAALRERRRRAADALTRLRIDERIVLTYLYARAWPQAIEAYEVFQSAGTSSPGTMAEMVWAYCESGQPERAAGLVQTLEASPLAGEPLFAPLLQRARVVFLAFAGQTAAVDAIVAPGALLGAVMPESARFYWAGVARLNAGDRSGAREALGKAARSSRRNRRVRELAEQRLGTIDEPGVAGPRAVSPALAEFVDKLARDAVDAPTSAELAADPRLLGHRGHRSTATIAMIAVNALAMGVVWLAYGATDSLATLARAGNTLAGVWAGEWWRLPTSMFVHVGLVHLGLNMYGLWVLGRFVEQIFGALRFVALYMVAGIAGAIASHWFSGAPMSAGASGAVLGLAGALLVELRLHRDEYPRTWRTHLFRVLLLLTAANVAIGFYYPAIDQGAHLGGLISGGLMAALLSPRGRAGRTRAIRGLAFALVVGTALAGAFGAYRVTTTSYAQTLAKYPVRTRVVGGVALDAPSLWAVQDGRLYDQSQVFMQLGLETIEVTRDLDPLLDEWLDAQMDIARQPPSKGGGGFDAVATVTGAPVVLPAPWHSREFVAIARGADRDREFRAVVVARAAPSGRQYWIGLAIFPDELAADLGPVIASVLGSARPAPTPP